MEPQIDSGTVFSFEGIDFPIYLGVYIMCIVFLFQLARDRSLLADNHFLKNMQVG